MAKAKALKLGEFVVGDTVKCTAMVRDNCYTVYDKGTEFIVYALDEESSLPGPMLVPVGGDEEDAVWFYWEDGEIACKGKFVSA